jgi:hypothetical protein
MENAYRKLTLTRSHLPWGKIRSLVFKSQKISEVEQVYGNTETIVKCLSNWNKDYYIIEEGLVYPRAEIKVEIDSGIYVMTTIPFLRINKNYTASIDYIIPQNSNAGTYKTLPQLLSAAIVKKYLKMPVTSRFIYFTPTKIKEFNIKFKDLNNVYENVILSSVSKIQDNIRPNKYCLDCINYDNCPLGKNKI